MADKCKNCGNKKFIKVSGKTSDLCYIEYDGATHDGYVLKEIGLGSDSNYIDFVYCPICGTIQGDVFPLSRDMIKCKIEEGDSY